MGSVWKSAVKSWDRNATNSKVAELPGYVRLSYVGESFGMDGTARERRGAAMLWKSEAY